MTDRAHLRTGRADPRAGFTLVELLIALMLLAIAILGMASALIGTSEWQTRTESHMELLAAGESKLEEMRTAAVEVTADTVELVVGGSLTSNETGHTDSLQTPEGMWLRRRWEVTSGPSAARTVTLRVMPMEDTDRTISARDLSTIILIEDS